MIYNIFLIFILYISLSVSLEFSPWFLDMRSISIIEPYLTPSVGSSVLHTYQNSPQFWFSCYPVLCSKNSCPYYTYTIYIWYFFFLSGTYLSINFCMYAYVFLFEYISSLNIPIFYFQSCWVPDPRELYNTRFNLQDCCTRGEHWHTLAVPIDLNRTIYVYHNHLFNSIAVPCTE